MDVRSAMVREGMHSADRALVIVGEVQQHAKAGEQRHSG